MNSKDNLGEEFAIERLAWHGLRAERFSSRGFGILLNLEQRESLDKAA
jgi:hypothetical protein